MLKILQARLQQYVKQELPKVQFSSVAQPCQLFDIPWTAAHQASLSITNSRSLLKFMSIKLVMLSNHLILCCPLLSSIFPSIRVFANASVLQIRWSNYWSFSFSISLSNEYSEPISFRMDRLDLPAVQGLSRVFSNTTVQKHQFFTSGGQSIGVSTLPSILPMNIQD